MWKQCQVDEVGKNKVAGNIKEESKKDNKMSSSATSVVATVALSIQFMCHMEGTHFSSRLLSKSEKTEK